MRIAVVGVSDTAVCGVRDHASVLGGALVRQGHEVHDLWIDRSPQTPPPAPVWRLGGWLGAGLDRVRPDVVVWHYSVFAHSYRGLPTVAVLVADALRRTAAPVVAVLHEYAFPWNRNGLRGKAWAASQRAALPLVVGAANALVITVDDRATWLASRRWIPRRPVTVLPVFSNFPVCSDLPVIYDRPGEALTGRAAPAVKIGVLSYGTADRPDLVTAAVGRLRQARPSIAFELVLLGGPGPDAPQSARWLAPASFGPAAAPLFTGVIAPEELAVAIGGCQILVFVDGAGPSSRKTTLAAGLASGRPVVALDGPESWSALVQAGGVELVQPHPGRIAEALVGLVDDGARRARLGAKGHRFYKEHQDVELIAGSVEALLDQVVGARSVTVAARSGPS